MNWEGSTGSNFVLVGEDGHPYHEARDVTVENNLMLGNSSNVMRAPLGVKGGRDVMFRNNTIVGDLPSLAYAMRLNTEGSNPANQQIRFYNNIWSDPTGTMGAENPGRPNDFSDTPVGETASFTLDHNLYWNGGDPIPQDGSELVNFTDDANRVVDDPLLAIPASTVVPRWNGNTGRFADGSATVREAFLRLVMRYGRLRRTSPAVDAGNSSQAPGTDIVGRPRWEGDAVDVGAFEWLLTGDMDDDGDVDFDDIGGFVLGLSDPDGHEAQFGIAAWFRGDTDGDGDLDFDDIDGFVTILSEPPAVMAQHEVPEPGSAVLLMSAAVVLALLTGHRVTESAIGGPRE